MFNFIKKFWISIAVAGIVVAAAFAVPFKSANALTTYLPYQGGTGTNCIPTYGQVLVGTAGGVYNCVATSTLGISSGSGGNVATSSTEVSSYIPFWTSNGATPATLSGGVAGFTFDGTKLTATYASTTALTASGNAFVGDLRFGFTQNRTIDTQSGTQVIVGGGQGAIIGPSTNAGISVTGAGRTGIASSSPWGWFSVEQNAANVPVFVVADQGTTSPFLMVGGNGFVGIGTSTPLAPLVISRNTVATDNTDMLRIANNSQSSFPFSVAILDVNNGTGGGCLKYSVLSIDGASLCYSHNSDVLTLVAGTTTLSMASTTGVSTFTGGLGIASTSPSARLALKGLGTGTGRLVAFSDSANAERFTILDNGRVGIGTLVPAQALDVNGVITNSAGSVTLSAFGGSTGLSVGNTSLQTVLSDFRQVPTTYTIANGAHMFRIIPGTIAGTATGNNSMLFVRPGASTVSVGPGLVLNGLEVDLSTITNTAGGQVNAGKFIGGTVVIGTSTGPYQLTVATTTAPQLALSAGAGVAQWTQRNAGGNLYFATTTVTGEATTTTSALSILGSNGFVGINNSAPTNLLTLNDSVTTGGTIKLNGTNAGITFDVWGFIRGGTSNTLVANSTSFALTGVTTQQLYASNNLRICADSCNGAGGTTRDITLRAGGAAGNVIIDNGNLGVSTTTPQYPLTISSTTAPQIALSNGAGVSQWTLRNAGGNFYLASTTVQGTATTTIPALSIIGSTGTVGIATSSPTSQFGGTLASAGPIYVGGTPSTATSTIEGNLRVQGNLAIGTGTSWIRDNATSTFSKGINIASGCFAVNGTCVSGGGGGGTIGGSIAVSQVPFGSGSNTIQGQSDFTFSGSTLVIGSGANSISVNGTGYVSNSNISWDGTGTLTAQNLIVNAQAQAGSVKTSSIVDSGDLTKIDPANNYLYNNLGREAIVWDDTSQNIVFNGYPTFAIQTVGDVSNQGTTPTNQGAGFYPDGGGTQTYAIFAYKNATDGNVFYSASEAMTVCSDSGSGNYDCQVSWDQVSDSDGYKVFLQDTSGTLTDCASAYNCSQTFAGTGSNGFTDNGTNWSTGATYSPTPISPYSNLYQIAKFVSSTGLASTTSLHVDSLAGGGSQLLQTNNAGDISGTGINPSVLSSIGVLVDGANNYYTTVGNNSGSNSINLVTSPSLSGVPNKGNVALGLMNDGCRVGALGIAFNSLCLGTFTTNPIASSTATIGQVFFLYGLNDRDSATVPSYKAGFGTSTPWALLSVQGATGAHDFGPNYTGNIPLMALASSTGATSFIVDASGKIGIGTSTPVGNLSIDSTTASTTIVMKKLQFEGQNAAGTVVCSYFVGTTLTTQTGPCNK